MFWIVDCEKRVYSLDLEGGAVALLDRANDPKWNVVHHVNSLSSTGLHNAQGGRILEVSGIFMTADAAFRASELLRDLKPWDDWFWDCTRPTLQAIGWQNPKLGLSRSAETVPTSEAELRFRSMLPDQPPARRA